MDSLSERLIYALKKLGVTQHELAKKINIKQQTIQSVCSGKIKKSKYAFDMANALEINPEWLINGLGDIAIDNRESKKSNLVPHISWRETNNLEKYIQHKDTKYIPFPAENRKLFALKMIGNSMYASSSGQGFAEGSFIIFDPKLPAKHKSFVVISICSDETICRQLSIEGNKKYLKTLNENYPDSIIVLNDNMKIHGVVIANLSLFL